MFFIPFAHWVGGGGGGQTALVRNLLLQFFTLGGSKIQVSKTYFFAIVVT